MVDFLGFDTMKSLAPLVFDVTHSLQRPGAGKGAALGRREQAYSLAKSGVASGISALFLELHPRPDEALCDGPSALPSDLLEPFLTGLLEIDRVVKAERAPRIH